VLIIENDYISQTISSSPISFLKISVALSTSAPVLVLKTSLRVCIFRISMKQRVVICFLTLKGLLDSELKPVYETEALAISTAKKRRKRFAEGRTSLYDYPRCGRPLAND
jgi:hypothetical protein